MQGHSRIGTIFELRVPSDKCDVASPLTIGFSHLPGGPTRSSPVLKAMDVCTPSYETGQSFNLQPVRGHGESATRSAVAPAAGGSKADRVTRPFRPRFRGAGPASAAGFRTPGTDAAFSLCCRRGASR